MKACNNFWVSFMSHRSRRLRGHEAFVRQFQAVIHLVRFEMLLRSRSAEEIALHGEKKALFDTHFRGTICLIQSSTDYRAFRTKTWTTISASVCAPTRVRPQDSTVWGTNKRSLSPARRCLQPSRVWAGMSGLLKANDGGGWGTRPGAAFPLG